MTEQQNTALQGPLMVVATSVMKKPPVRVGQIVEGFSLPRPVRLSVLIAGSAGALLGALVGFVLGGFSSAVYGAAILAALGGLAVTYSPLAGESLAKWLQLTLRSRTKRTQQATFAGERVRVAVGICPVAEPASQALVRIWPGSLRVPPSQYDRRGVRLSPQNRNLSESEIAPGLSEWFQGSAGTVESSPDHLDEAVLAAFERPLPQPAAGQEQPWVPPGEQPPAAYSPSRRRSGRSR